MSAVSAAFGMLLEADFRIPGGGVEAAVGRPRLALRLTSPRELTAIVGEEPTSAWRGRLGDGEELTVARDAGGDLLFGYGERARFRYDRLRDRLECAPVEPEDDAWRRVLLTRVLPNVAIARGSEALHGCAVAGARGTVAIVAAGGSGKSTLALELVRRGGRLFADDSVVLDRRGEEIEAWPAGPFMNLASDREAPAGARHLGRFGEENWIAVADAATAPAPLAAIVFLSRGPGNRLRTAPLSAGPLELAPFMLGLPDDEGRDGPRFALYADLVERTPMLRLSGGPRDTPAELARTLEDALESLPRPLVGSAA
jgi:hypothetical protein